MQNNAEANRELIQRLTDAWNDRDRDAMGALYADEFTSHGDSETTRTREAQLDAEWGFFDAFPDIRARIEDVLGDDDRVLVRWSVTGTHRGEFAGIEPTGNEISYEEWALYDVVDGLLAGVRAIQGELDILVGLGAVEWPQE